MIRVFNNGGKYRFNKNETIFITKHVIKYESSKEVEINIIFTGDKFSQEEYEKRGGKKDEERFFDGRIIIKA